MVQEILLAMASQPQEYNLVRNAFYKLERVRDDRWLEMQKDSGVSVAVATMPRIWCQPEAYKDSLMLNKLCKKVYTIGLLRAKSSEPNLKKSPRDL